MQTVIKNKAPSFILRLILLTLIPLVVVVGYVYNFQNLITLIYIPALFIISLHLNKYKLCLNKPAKYYILFFLITLLSAFTATYLDVYVKETKTALGCIIFGLTIFNFVLYNIKNAKYILISYILATYLLSFYLYKNGSLNINLINDTSYRVEDDIFNANQFSYYIFLGLFSFYLLFEIYKNKIIIISFIITSILYLLVIFLSGSRGGILMYIIVNIIYFTFIGFVNKPKLVKPAIIAALIIVVCLPILTYIYLFILEQTNLGFRFKVFLEEGEDTSRIVILKEAADAFLSNPILGVGSGNFTFLNRHQMFSHNNLVEILVNNGIFAFALYITAFITLTVEAYYCFKRFRLLYKRISAIVILFVAMFLIYSFFYVFVRVLPYTGFIFLLIAIIYITKQFHLEENSEVDNLF